MITKDQLEELYTFCEKKGVRYYDLQTELVDHLSEAIEAKMRANAALQFDDALAEVYKGFGIFGFSHVVANKESALVKEHRKRRWQHFKTWFTWPKIAVTFLLLALMYLPFTIFPQLNLQVYHFCIVALSVMLGLGLFIFAAVHYKKPVRKLMALNSWGRGFGAFVAVLQLPNFYNFLLKGLDVDLTVSFWSNMVFLCFAAFFIVGALAEYGAYTKIYEEMRKQYPEIFIDSIPNKAIS